MALPMVFALFYSGGPEAVFRGWWRKRRRKEMCIASAA